MDKRINPFNELYVTENVNSSDFVKLFSPALIRNVEPLFLPGNIVLTGVKGSGKSMLLNLLIPELRIAYISAGEAFPVPQHLSRFVGAGISLIRNRVIDFGQRPLGLPNEEESLPLLFGDFLNYFIVYDLLNSLETFINESRGLVADELGISKSQEQLDSISHEIAHHDCWFGALDGTRDFTELKQNLAKRINSYLRFLNFNDPKLSEVIIRSKSSVGEPISVSTRLLHGGGVVPFNVHFFVRIDQYEELSNLEGVNKQLGPIYQSVINKVVSLRDPNVSYRIGTRIYGWNNNPKIYGTIANLEEDRNYKKIDLDEVLRRKENVTNWVFPNFAEDVFRRRLNMAGHSIDKSTDLISKVVGKGLSGKEKAKLYAGSSPLRAIRSEKDWPEEWTSFLSELALNDPLSARLAEAWCRQRGKQGVMHHIPEKPFPWDNGYWYKERVEAALMQIASRCGQRMMWMGADDVIELSGGNILIFVSLCQHIWAAWLRTIRDPNTQADIIPEINVTVQAVGILEASTHWYDKIVEDSNGENRQNFLSKVANLLQKDMFQDAPLSYPGHNGFSVRNDELDTEPELKIYLQDNVSYGVFIALPHTTKTGDRMPRTKWYPNHIYCPHFRLPHVHTKEPKYLSIQDLAHYVRDVDDRITATRLQRRPDRVENSTAHIVQQLFEFEGE